MRGTTTDYYNEDNANAFGLFNDYADYSDEPLATTDQGLNSLPAGGLNDWGTWARNIGGVIVTGAVDTYKYRNIGQAGGIPAIAPNGQVYTEGNRVPAPRPGVSVGGMSISPVLLLAGAGLVALLLVMRK